MKSTGDSAFSPSDDSLSLRISRSVRRSRRLFLGVIVAAFLFLEGLVIASSYESSRRGLNEWIILNQPQIEQALFLQNALSIQGLLDRFKSGERENFEREIGIFSPGGELLHGELNRNGFLPKPELPQNFSFELLPPRIRYSSPLRFGGQPVGWLLIHSSFQIRTVLLHTLFAATACLLILLLFQKLLHSLVRLTDECAVRPMNHLKEAMSEFGNIGSTMRLSEKSGNYPLEVREVFQGFDSLTETIVAYSRREGDAAAALARSDLAAQVAHDVRSPLSTLKLALQDISSLPEGKRQIVRLALERISDIAHQLLAAYSRRTQDESAAPLEARPELLSSSLDEIVSEKRIQLRNRLDLRLEFRVSENSGALFSAIHPTEFKRLISNLLDNSSEAIDGAGRILVTLDADPSGNPRITLEDSGKGIDPALLNRLGEKGLSQGKFSGSGLGLHHALSTLQSWNSTIRFESPIANGRGTRATIVLLRSPIPDWFAPELQVFDGARFFVLDDDESVHRLWEQRLAPWLSNRNCQIQCFSHASEFERAIDQKIQTEEIYLIDHDLGAVGPNGLDLIEKLRLGPRAYLVTSHFENSEIRRRVIAAGARIIPKSLAAGLPIQG